MKLKSVTFIDSTFRNCIFDDVTSVGSFFRNCTFVDAFFYNTGELRDATFTVTQTLTLLLDLTFFLLSLGQTSTTPS